MEDSFDVIIVGGRPAGASLAARLGAENIRVLVLERDSMPSAPAVSCPVILSSGMKLLDEIGVREEEFAHDTPRMRRLVLEFSDHFRIFLALPSAHGRDYMYGLDRSTFDHALWKNLARFPSVALREKFTVTDLSRDDTGRVVGVSGHGSKSAEERFTAKCVVGADGRFSLVARKAPAAITEERVDVNTAIYYAYWQNCAPYDDDGEVLFHIHTSSDGFNCALMPSAGGKMGTLVQCRRDYFDAEPGQIERWYLEKLQRYPRIWRRMGAAERVGSIRGMKEVRNLYREAGGAGWVLVGDALHQKDSLDAQGIHDALAQSKLLSRAIVDWQRGHKSWEEAIDGYQRAVYEETHPMFLATMDRLKREMYSEPPALVVKTALRWILSDPEYQRRLGLAVTRAIPPLGWAPPSLMAKAILQGVVGDLRRLIPGSSRGNSSM